MDRRGDPGPLPEPVEGSAQGFQRSSKHGRFDKLSVHISKSSMTTFRLVVFYRDQNERPADFQAGEIPSTIHVTNGVKPVCISLSICYEAHPAMKSEVVKFSGISLKWYFIGPD